jgi:hypothetical protein
MYKYKKPLNDLSRLSALVRIAQKGASDAHENITLLRPETLAQMTALAAQFAAAMDSANEAKSAQGAGVAAAATTIESVSCYIRDIWSAVKRRTVREKLPTAVQIYYGLPLNGKTPKLANQAAWLNQAERLIQGEAAAVAAGYLPLADPTIAQLQNKLNAARTAVNQREIAKANYDNRSAALSRLRQQADRLIATAMHQLRVSLREETAAHRREVMRRYGARFSQIVEGIPVVEEEMAVQTLSAAAAMSESQLYAVPTVSGNGAAIHVN